MCVHVCVCACVCVCMCVCVCVCVLDMMQAYECMQACELVNMLCVHCACVCCFLYKHTVHMLWALHSEVSTLLLTALLIHVSIFGQPGPKALPLPNRKISIGVNVYVMI